MTDDILRFENIRKEYPGVTALKDINLSLKKGDIHALVGENGAGKSTLIKLLTGAIEKSSGKIFYQGKEIKNNSPIKSLEMNIIPVYQELNMIPTLSVCDNIFYGHEKTKGITLDKKAMRDKTKELLKEVGLNLSPKTKARELSVGNQQLVEIAKALIKDVEVLILDEPTASLTEIEKENLFQIIKDFQKKGISIIYISHRLDEVLELADTITVLRNGEVIDPKTAGEVFINGVLKKIDRPKDAVDEKITFITEDRKNLGLMLDLSVLENVTYASLNTVTKNGRIDKEEEKRRVEEILEKLNVKYASLDEEVGNLSGGNQQKVVIAKWLLTNASILIFDEPTRGIDVGSKEEIYRILRNLAKEGKSIILISSENEEIMNITDRVLVMSKGEIASEYQSEDLTADALFKDSARLL